MLVNIAFHILFYFIFSQEDKSAFDYLFVSIDFILPYVILYCFSLNIIDIESKYDKVYVYLVSPDIIYHLVCVNTPKKISTIHRSI